MYPKFEQLANAIGALPALTLCAFCESSVNLYVPGLYQPGHMLERVLGESAYLALIANFGGETIFPPAMRFEQERRLGLIYRLTRRGLSNSEIAERTEIGSPRIRQIQAAIASGKPLTQLARKP
jgi:hypothetical protein